MTGYYNKRRKWGGYTDIGAILIPPRPQMIVMTDRDTGVLWSVSFSTNPVERLSINDVYTGIQRQEGVTIYGPYDGPVMDQDGEFRLFVRNSRIGLDYTPFPIGEIGLDNMPPYARISADQRQLNIDSVDISTVHIGYIAP